MITVTLDAGHFGKTNRSPVTKEYYESERMWLLSQYLKKELASLGCRVKMTRAVQAKDLAVYERGRLASGTDLFISLHSDACGDETVSRLTVFSAFDDKNNAFVLADMLAKEAAGIMRIKKYAVKRKVNSKGNNEYYGVMRGARNAGCPLYYIIEHGFHTNARDSRWLMDDKNLSELARAEARTIMLYFSLSGRFGNMLYGFKPKTTVSEALSVLSRLGYDASADKKGEAYIATGDSITVGGNKYQAVVMGDINGDGRVSIIDYAYARRFGMGKVTLSDLQRAALDLDGDGIISDSDINAMRNAIIGRF